MGGGGLGCNGVGELSWFRIVPEADSHGRGNELSVFLEGREFSNKSIDWHCLVVFDSFKGGI